MLHVLQVLIPTKRIFTFTFSIGVSITNRNIFLAGLTEASYLAVLLSPKHLFVVLYVMALPDMSCGY